MTEQHEYEEQTAAPPVDDATRSLEALSEDIVTAIRRAEAAQQASVCNSPDELPDDLAKALERRVEVNLAQFDGGPVRRVGGSDPEVRRLEAPFSRRVVPASTDGDSHRRRSTKKKSTKRGQS